MRAGIFAVVLVVGSGACGSPADPPDDVDSGGTTVQDGGPDPGGDAAPGTAGLRLTFGSDPILPGALGGDPYGAYVDETRVELRDLRAVGDSETGENTTRPSLSLRWGDSSGGGDDGGDDGGGDDLARSGGESDDDVEVLFPTAPPGYYSYIKADIMSYRVRGTVNVGGSARFEIDDSPPTPLSITIALDDFLLEGETTRTISIHCSLHQVVGDVPWNEVDGGGGGGGGDDLKIEEGDPEVAGVRAAMGQAFTATVVDQAR